MKKALIRQFEKLWPELSPYPIHWMTQEELRGKGLIGNERFNSEEANIAFKAFRIGICPPLSVPCPRCGVAVGELCRTGMHESLTIHNARRKAVTANAGSPSAA